MQIVLYAVGRMKPGPEKALFDHYAGRLPQRLAVVEVVEKRNLSADERRRAEAGLLTAKIPADAALVAFDERGTETDSRGFAQSLQDWTDEGRGSLTLVIGGADGLHETMLRRADNIISLGRMTWPHMLVRGLVAEQLFRAHCILTGHPYHRG